MKELKNLLISLAITGNIIFIAWVSYNAIDDGFNGTLPEKVSGIFLIILLAVNSFLLLSYKTRSKPIVQN
jgi:hypothetical protein